MPRPPFEVADIFRQFGDTYRKVFRPTAEQRRVMWAIENCRTATMGGHAYVCDRCGERQNRYNSCRNRHCPKCQSLQTTAWLEARVRDLLPVQYFHVVFTIPAELRPLFLGHQKLLYNALFGAAWDALRTIGREPRHLGAVVGALAVLHTWSQTLGYHPHVHFVVPGGGLRAGGRDWVPAREDHLLPVNVLAARFRTALLARIDEAYHHQQLDLGGSLSELAHPVRFGDFLDQLRRRSWVVYAKAPFAGPHQVLRYLARYTHRVAISNYRLIDLDDGRVSFRYKDYRAGGVGKVMSLDAVELVRRFLLHVLPPRFVRLRYFGFLANRNRRAAVETIREQLGTDLPAEATAEHETWQAQLLRVADIDPTRCPACGEGTLVALPGPPPPAPGRPVFSQRAPP